MKCYNKKIEEPEYAAKIKVYLNQKFLEHKEKKSLNQN
jgi:hypothetical protein